MTVPGALAEALGRVLDAPGVRRQVETQGVEFLRRAASLDSMARRFISLYQLAEGRRHRGDRSFPA